MIFDAGFFPIGSDPGALNLNIASSLNGGNLFSFHFSALNTRIFAGPFFESNLVHIYSLEALCFPSLQIVAIATAFFGWEVEVVTGAAAMERQRLARHIRTQTLLQQTGTRASGIRPRVTTCGPAAAVMAAAGAARQPPLFQMLQARRVPTPLCGTGPALRRRPSPREQSRPARDALR